MHLLLNKLQTTYSFSDREISLIRYGIQTLWGELSKCMIMFIYFHTINQTLEFFVGSFILLLLRRNTGGLHMKHYWSCFFFSFLFMNAAVLLLPAAITVTKAEICFLTLFCTVITWRIGPVHVKFLKNPNNLLIKKGRRCAICILFLYWTIAILSPVSKHLVIGFWVILLQTIQLMIAKYKEVHFYEEQN